MGCVVKYASLVSGEAVGYSWRVSLCSGHDNYPPSGDCDSWPAHTSLTTFLSVEIIYILMDYRPQIDSQGQFNSITIYMIAYHIIGSITIVELH